MRLARHLLAVYGAYALGFASLFVIWQLTSIYLVGSVLFPPPTVVLRKGLMTAVIVPLPPKSPDSQLIVSGTFG